MDFGKGAGREGKGHRKPTVNARNRENLNGDASHLRAAVVMRIDLEGAAWVMAHPQGSSTMKDVVRKISMPDIWFVGSESKFFTLIRNFHEAEL